MRRNVRGEVRIDPSADGADIEYSLSSVWRLLDQSVSGRQDGAHFRPSASCAQTFCLSSRGQHAPGNALGWTLSFLLRWANPMLPLVCRVSIPVAQSDHWKVGGIKWKLTSRDQGLAGYVRILSDCVFRAPIIVSASYRLFKHTLPVRLSQIKLACPAVLFNLISCTSRVVTPTRRTTAARTFRQSQEGQNALTFFIVPLKRALSEMKLSSPIWSSSVKCKHRSLFVNAVLTASALTDERWLQTRADPAHVVTSQWPATAAGGGLASLKTLFSSIFHCLNSSNGVFGCWEWRK